MHQEAYNVWKNIKIYDLIWYFSLSKPSLFANSISYPLFFLIYATFKKNSFLYIIKLNAKMQKFSFNLIFFYDKILRILGCYCFKPILKVEKFLIFPISHIIIYQTIES